MTSMSDAPNDSTYSSTSRSSPASRCASAMLRAVSCSADSAPASSSRSRMTSCRGRGRCSGRCGAESVERRCGTRCCQYWVQRPCAAALRLENTRELCHTMRGAIRGAQVIRPAEARLCPRARGSPGERRSVSTAQRRARCPPLRCQPAREFWCRGRACWARRPEQDTSAASWRI
jgi:hypothetical protein